MNIYSRSVFFSLSADTQIAPVIQHTLNAALYINQKKVAWVELKHAPRPLHACVGTCCSVSVKKKTQNGK